MCNLYFIQRFFILVFVEIVSIRLFLNFRLFLIIHSPNRFLWLNSWEFLTYAEGYLMALSAEKQQPDLHSTFFSPQVDRWLIVEINQIYRSSIDRPWISKCKPQKSGVNYTVKSNLQSWNYSVKVIYE